MEIFTVCMPLIFDTILVDPKLLVAVRSPAADRANDTCKGQHCFSAARRSLYACIAFMCSH